MLKSQGRRKLVPWKTNRTSFRRSKEPGAQKAGFLEDPAKETASWKHKTSPVAVEVLLGFRWV